MPENPDLPLLPCARTATQAALPPPKRRRLGISDAQKQALRAFWANSSPKPTQSACATWFSSQFDHTINRVSVSRILSSQYEHLDSGPVGSNMRVSSSFWPILDQKLSDWVTGHINSGYPITGPLLQTKAAEIWSQIPEYQNQQRPAFSDGWLTRFKKRHNRRYHTFHGEAASVPSSVHDQMKEIRTICDQYKPSEIYTMDETGLFWRQMPNGGLSDRKIAGKNKNKTRISLIVATNADGSDRMPLWLIGSAKTPRALRTTNFQALGCVWRWGKKAWMRQAIMEEWLRAFYMRIPIDKKVLLFLNNASPHIAGLKHLPPPSHIRVVFFPANATSIYRPLDQGIIQNLKHHYRRKWMRWMIAILDRGLDPHIRMNISYALSWITQAWKISVSDESIKNCFIKSSLIRLDSQDETKGEQTETEDQTETDSQPMSEPGLTSEIQTLYNKAIEKLGQDDIIPFDQFLNPTEEDIAVEDEIDRQDIYIDMESSEAQDLEENGPPPEILSNSEVMFQLQGILLWAGSKEKCTPDHIRQIENLISNFSRFQGEEKRQVTLKDMGWKPK
ncbi:hypothetical protein N7478_012678 [Penicillium angulare]|uniref:uncharacterized protein n=1 Tax=Penicillium angulare TaxID=116970 RepID=UPI002541DC65|nr:uncharacterized protein N7478_012678 [Penicillium angulare]KAJ5256574.1 hypothetical protein N7478_012678 [Penicillium angulare]